MKKAKIICIFIILSGIGLFIYTCFFLPAASPVYQWCFGLASALIILGLGYLINTLLILSEKSNYKSTSKEPYFITVKHKSGYLVCKIMNILLCIYLLILDKLQVEPIVLILSIALVLIQFLLDLLFQIFFYRKKKE